MAVMRSCCCCSPKTGTCIISVTYMFCTAAILIGLGIAYAYYDVYLAPVLKAIDDFAANPATPTIDLVLHSEITVSSILVGALIINGIYFLLCIMLFAGACKESAGYLMPWIIFDFIRQLLFFAAFVAVSWFLSLLIQVDDLDSTVLSLFCILLILIICIQFYFWLAVIGAYQVFREQDRIRPVNEYPMVQSPELKGLHDPYSSLE